MTSGGLQCEECGEVATISLTNAARAPVLTNQLIDENGLEELTESAAHTHALAMLADADMPNPPMLGTAIRSRTAGPDAVSLHRKPRADQPVDQDRIDDEVATVKALARKI